MSDSYVYAAIAMLRSVNRVYFQARDVDEYARELDIDIKLSKSTKTRVLAELIQKGLLNKYRDWNHTSKTYCIADRAKG